MSSCLRMGKVGYALGLALLVRRTSWCNRAAFVGIVRLSPATFGKAAYLLALAVVVSLLIAPSRSRGQQFRGLPAYPGFSGIPFTPILPTFGTGFAGFTAPRMLMTPAIPAFPSFPLMAGPMPNLMLNNFGTDSTGLYNPFLAGFGGFASVGFGGFVNPFGFGSFNTFGFGNGLGMQGGFGFNNFGTFTGFGGFGGFGGFNRLGFGGGMGGFAGKGFGGFNGSKPL